MKILFFLLAVFAFIAFVNCEVDCGRCPYNYDPVCAIKKSDGTKATFGNLCAFDLYNCMNGDVYEFLSEGECPPSK